MFLHISGEFERVQNLLAAHVADGKKVLRLHRHSMFMVIKRLNLGS
jgi:hypothetical protein